MGLGLKDHDEEKSHHQPHIYKPADEQGLYDDLEGGDFGRSLSSSLGLPLPNPAPDIDISASIPGNKMIIFYVFFFKENKHIELA